MIIAHQPVPLAVRGRLSSQFRSDSRPSDGQIFRPSDGQTFPDRPISFITNLLRTLCRHQKSQLLYNQAKPNSSCKTPGVEVPQHFRAKLRSRRHMRHVAPLSPVASLDCAYFLSPRGVPPLALRISRLWPSPFGSPFVFILLRIALLASPFFSKPSTLPRGVGVPNEFPALLLCLHP